MNVKFIGVILVLVVGLIGIGILSGEDEATSTGEGNSSTTVSTSNALGDPSSKVVLTEALDFGCGVCAQFHSILKNDATGEDVFAEYADRIYIETKHFPIPANGNSFAAHRAAEAAAAQGKYWEMHDILFESRSLWVEQATTNPIPQFETFAADLELNVEQFKVDFASSATNNRINEEKEEMTDAGANATPTFFLNGELLSNNEIASPDALRAVLDAALAEANGDQADVEEPTADQAEEVESTEPETTN